MSFDHVVEYRPKIAVIGGGISGIAAAHLLKDRAAVTLFEKEPHLGGHARTVLAGKYGHQPVDTGFIVFNYVNYPHLTRFFEELGVPVEKSDMSFGVTVDQGKLEYSLTSLGSLFAQKRNAVSPQFIRMLKDIFTFNRRAESQLSSEAQTIGQLTDQLKLGSAFKDNYLIPLCGAIWSTPADQIMEFPASTLVKFLKNHALMSATGQHQWWTVSGGSTEYVWRAEKHLLEHGVTINKGVKIGSVRRHHDCVSIAFENGQIEVFDEVIFATHPDVSLNLIANPTTREISALGAVKFQDNLAVLHSDERQMPRKRSCWSSWVYQTQSDTKQKNVGVTYWMNRLQNIPENDPLFVTLNPSTPIDPNQIYDSNVFRHPVFDHGALHAQKEISSFQGQNRTWFTGAWLRHGFHEDGFASAVAVANAMSKVNA